MTDQQEAEALRRDCPTCGREIAAAATTCGYCWTKLTPLAPGMGRPAARRAGDGGADGSTAEYLAAPRRTCPKCGGRVMAVATKCGYCWAKLTPLAQPAAVPPDHAAAEKPNRERQLPAEVPAVPLQP